MNLRERSDALISTRLNDVERETYEILVSRHKESAIKMEEFFDIYGETTVRRDLDEVTRLEKIFLQKNRDLSPEKVDEGKRAKILEALLVERIELDNWLGQEAQTIVTSVFDDYKNAVDLLVEFQRDEGFKYLALSIDATTSALSIPNKIERIRSGLIFGQMATIKYFHSEESGIKGKLEKIPKVIVGVSPATIKELAFLWINAHKSKKEAARLEKEPDSASQEQEEIKKLRTTAKESLSKLASHNVQFLILEEIKIQLEGFIKYAKKIGRTDIEDKYTKALTTVAKIIGEKKAESNLSEEAISIAKKDPIYLSIEKEISSL